MAKKRNSNTTAKKPANVAVRSWRDWRISTFAKTVILYSILALSAFVYTATVFMNKEFGEVQVEELLFLLMNGLAGGNTADSIAMLYDNAMLFSIIFLLFLVPVVDFYRNKIFLHFNLSLFGKNKTVTFNPSKISWWIKLAYTLVVLGATVWFMLVSFQVPAYLRSISEVSLLFEDEYIDPRNVELAFPDKKQNLIFIFLESMENTVASHAAGGQKDRSLIPELEQLALREDTVSFSHAQQGLGGAHPVIGTTWTAASLTSHMLGVPIKPNFTGLDGNDYGKLDQFFPGAYGVGDVLNEAGYNQSFVMGSDQTFGGRDKLLAQHGGYHVIDLEYVRKTGLLPEEYKVWWGYEDRKMFAYAKDEALRLSQKDAPFNLSMLTVDTHFPDGYLDPSCAIDHPQQYDNVYACSSAQVSEFVDWVQAQPFADDTTIVIAGDHPGMQNSYYEAFIPNDSYRRTTYNVFINPVSRPDIERPRQFAAFDMYPTTLGALGVKIPGERLAMGVNLFASNVPTLMEQFGSPEALSKELSKRSYMYDQKLLTASE